ncbi:MAG: cobalamin-binding protein [Verrucomicrobia bacterium Tous-C9LFEB]|nr:MAG: cobalamin-binding protein [Verrucomicrobia bacterium Tous-C9LFEB]
MSKELILKKFTDAVVNGDEDLAVEAANEAIASNLDATEAIVDGLSKGMGIVGEYFESQEYFLPEVIVASEAFKAGVKILQPHIKVQQGTKPSKIVIGTVQGDTHDIGKNIVGIMLGAAGFEVIDVGRDVSPKAFVDKVKETNADLLGLSALMTTSMVNMKKVLALLNEEGVRGQVKVMIGGAAISQRYADEIGADGYSVDAVAAVRLAQKLVAVAA